MRPKYTITKAFLEEQHLVYKKTGKQIAEMVGCTGANISIYFKRFGITNHSNQYKVGKPLNSNTKFTSGNIPWNKGISVPSSNKGKTFPRGEKHWNWKENKKPQRIRGTDYQELRQQVFNRDSYTCTICGQKGGILHMDHIQPWSLFPDLRFELSNVRTLCAPCHRKTDTYGGRVHNFADGGTIKSVALV